MNAVAKHPRGKTRNLKVLVSKLPVVQPSAVLPLSENCDSVYDAAKRVGILLVIRRSEEGWRVWRIR